MILSRGEWTCWKCLQNPRVRFHDATTSIPVQRAFSISSPLRKVDDAPRPAINGPQDGSKGEKEQGAMSRRLSEMTEETMETGGRSAQKAMNEAGFSEELKKQLESRIAETTFRSQNQQALSQAEMPSIAGKGTRDTAAAPVWTGTETLPDAALRMLDDSHKRLRSPTRAPRIPTNVNLRPAPKPKAATTGQRLANARDKTSIYALSQQEQLSEKEREQMRKELKERFTPGARPMPTTLHGLTSLANERIEDAIARGQFKNIPRGKGKNIEKDYMANSPFLDTTEYFMNKIIQKQEIVPPWIEKQQELVKGVQTFRARLRADWRRHAARLIASRGGSLQTQVRRAQAYAAAENALNPRQEKKEVLNEIDGEGKLSQVTVKETPPAVPEAAAAVAEPVVPPEQPPTTTTTITVTESLASEDDTTSSSPEVVANSTTPLHPPAPQPLPTLPPFRDPDWERLEHAYHTLAIAHLNTLTRSYNLMAPQIAQKPYHSLPRELARCYADVAPQLPGEIESRARAPPDRIRVEVVGHRPGGVMEKFGAGERVKVYDEDLGRKGYGFKEFWKDLWGGEGVKA